MAETLTTDIPLGFMAPEFYLENTIDGEKLAFEDVRGQNGTLVMFICNHCPFVIHVRDELVQLANDYIEQGIGFVAISSNDIENYPDDSPDLMKKMAIDHNFPFPYLYDEDQDVAKAYDAACTPDFSIFDENDQCVYRGQLDDSRPGNNVPVTGYSIREALDTVLAGGVVFADEQKPSVGCGIKWKK